MVAGAEHAKRPDIMVFDGDEPIMIIECKVGAGFTEGAFVENGSSAAHKVDQLRFYDKWLAARTTRPVALVLLTHLVDAPIDFLVDRGKYQSALRSVKRWSQLYRWLTTEDRQTWWKDVDRALVDETIQFLKEKELMSENPTLNDFAAARLYLGGGAYARIADALRITRRSIESRFAKSLLSGFPNKPPVIKSLETEGWISDWCRAGKNPVIGWGFYFCQESSECWSEYSPPVALLQGAYVVIEFEVTSQRPKGQEFSRWHFPTWKYEDADEFGVYVVEPLTSFTGEFSPAYSSWVADQFHDALKLIDAVK